MSRTPVIEWPKVSALIPCRNEEDFIATCLDSVLAQDYPKDLLEVIVCDGESTDGTAEIVRSYAARHPRIRLLSNPGRTLASGWNLGFQVSTGDVFCAMIAHQTYRSDYVTTSLRYMREHDADAVGGVLRTLPQHDTRIGRAIAASWSHPFGVGNARFRTGTARPAWVDNVHCGVFRRSAYELAGGYNEELTRSQDADFQTRLRARGGRILLVPEVFSDYYTRSRFVPFARFCFVNGYWVVRPLAHGAWIRSLRHWIPLLFVLVLLSLGVLATFMTLARWLLGAVLITYGAAAIAASLQVVASRRDPQFLLLMPIVFATMHFGYGIGSLVAVLELVVRTSHHHLTSNA